MMKKSLSALSISLLLLLSLGNSLLAAETKKTTDYVADLQSDNRATLLAAIQTAGEKKEAKALDPLVKLLKNHPDSYVRVQAAAAVGKIPVKTTPIEALKDAVLHDKDNRVVYAALLAMTSLDSVEKDLYKMQPVKEAMEFADQNKKDDIYITDLVKRYKNLLAGKK